jgi:hypothetical protein
MQIGQLIEPVLMYFSFQQAELNDEYKITVFFNCYNITFAGFTPECINMFNDAIIAYGFRRCMV